MTAIEDRVVSMKFDGDQFLAGVDKSLTALDKLNSKLKMEDGTKGLSQIGSAADSQSGKLGKIADVVDNVGGKFKALSIVGITALADITTKALDTGTALAKSLTIAPIQAGFQNYETQIKAVQTILANTASEGTKIGDVNKVLAQLNDYANKTVYNFGQMTANIGTFTAAGVKLKPAADSIKGIANLAALSGSSAEQASTAMYQLSQAIAAGKVSLQDWNSVVNAGLGGKTFQTALVNTARASGVSIDAIIKKAGSFRNSLQQGWLTSKILTQTLSQFTGDLTEKQIKAMGFTDAEAKSILKTGQIAIDAATKIKTLSQLTEALKEEVGSAWAGVFKTIFGDIGQATELFSAAHNVMENALTGPVKDLNALLQGWAKLGGRTAIIKSISNVFQALGSVLKPIKEAFREIFPPTTAKQLADMSKSFEKFTANLKIGGTTANEIKRIFAGVFAVLDIGWQIIKNVTKVFFDLIGVATSGSGGFLKWIAQFGDFLVELDQAIKKGQGFSDFFKNIGKFLAGPIELLKKLTGYIGHLFDGFDGKKTADNLIAKFKPFSALGNAIGSVWGKIGAILDAVWKVFQPLAKKFASFFSTLGQSIASVFSGLNFDSVLKTIDTGLFAGLVVLFKKLVDKFKGGGFGGTGLFDSVKESFEQLTSTLGQMQKVLKATTLLEIATAVGILAISVVALSKIDAKGLATSLGAITIMFGQLIASMSLMQKFLTGTGAIKLPVIAAGMILLAAAVDILASAVIKLAGLDWQSLLRGLTGLGGVLAGLTAAANLIPSGKKMLLTSVGLIALATSVRILVGAVTNLSGLSWEDLAKGLVGVGVLLGSLALFTKFMEADKAGILSGTGLLILATGMKVLASAVSDLGKLSLSEIGKGLVAMAGGLTLIVAALNLMPPQTVLSAASILIVATSLGLLADALAKMGGMSWSAIGKSLVELAGSLTIIALATAGMEEALPGAAALIVVAASLGMLAQAMTVMGGMSWSEIAKSLVELAGALTLIALGTAAMEEALPGAAALIVVAGALAILAPVMVALGGLSWEEIGKGLVAIAGAFTVIGVAGALLTPVVPSLIGLGAAILLLGAGAALAGVGILALSVGLTALAVAGAAGIATLVALVSALIGLIPAAFTAIGQGVIAFANVIATAGPAMTNALVTVLNSLLDAVNKLGPKLVDTMGHLAVSMAQSLVKYEPQMVSAGLTLLIGFLNGVASKIGAVITAATNLAVAFINGIARNNGRVTDAAVKMVISFVNGLANAIRNNSAAMQAAGRNLAFAIIDGMTGGLASGIGRVVNKAEDIARSALNAAKSILGINSPSKEFEKIGNYVNDGFVKGLNGNKGQIDAAFTSLRNQIASAMNDSGRSIDTLTARLNRLESARHKNRDEIRKTKEDLSQANKEHRAEAAAYTEVTKALSNQHTKLGKLANQYDVLTTKIKAAQESLANAIKTRDDFNAQITQQFSAATAPTTDQTAADYVAQLQKQVADTNSFANALQQLRKLGLNDDAYKQLLTGGIADLPFVQDLLKGGKTNIDQINALQTQLDTVAKSMGKSASSSLYQAAVDSAQGLVDGLKKQQAAIEKQMDIIADAMVKAIKKKLGIKSPSRVFKEVGGFSGQGLADGLDASIDTVAKSAENVGNAAVLSLQKSLSDTSKMTLSAIDTQPTIRPVLDLTDVKKGAGQINDALNKATLSTSGALSNAMVVSAAVNSSGGQAGDGTVGASGSVIFNQYNTSPKAISTADTYRQTKNQLSKAKGALP